MVSPQLFYFQVSEDIGERQLNICLLLSYIPEGGLECDATVYLEPRSATACEWLVHNSVITTFSY